LQEGKLRYLNLKGTRKYVKRILPLRIRNRKFGRQNYFKYAANNAQERVFEENRKRMNRVKPKDKRYFYSYYSLQRNFNKQLIKFQPKLFAKDLFDAGTWLRKQKLSSTVKLRVFFMPKITNRFRGYDVLS